MTVWLYQTFHTETMYDFSAFLSRQDIIDRFFLIFLRLWQKFYARLLKVSKKVTTTTEYAAHFLIYEMRWKLLKTLLILFFGGVVLKCTIVTYALYDDDDETKCDRNKNDILNFSSSFWVCCKWLYRPIKEGNVKIVWRW